MNRKTLGQIPKELNFIFIIKRTIQYIINIVIHFTQNIVSQSNFKEFITDNIKLIDKKNKIIYKQFDL